MQRVGSPCSPAIFRWPRFQFTPFWLYSMASTETYKAVDILNVIAVIDIKMKSTIDYKCIYCSEMDCYLHNDIREKEQYPLLSSVGKGVDWILLLSAWKQCKMPAALNLNIGNYLVVYRYNHITIFKEGPTNQFFYHVHFSEEFWHCITNSSILQCNIIMGRTKTLVN